MTRGGAKRVLGAPRGFGDINGNTVILPNESVLPRVVLPLLSRHVLLPRESVRPRVVFPSLSRHVLLPIESVEHLVCAIAPQETIESTTAMPKVSADFAFI